MKKTRLLLTAALSLSLVTTLFAFTACDGGGGSVAATVNGTQIMEQDVTDTIEAMRAQNEEYSDPAMWAQALASSGLTPESLRETVIDSKASDIVITQEAEAQGFTVDEAAIDEQVAQTKETVGSADDEAWLATLQQYGYKDEAAYRAMLVVNDLTNQLYESYTVEPTDEELTQFIADNPTAVEGYTLPALESEANATEEVTPEVDATEGTADETAATDETAAADEAAAAEGAEAATTETVTVPVEDVDLSAIPEDILDQYTQLWSDNNKGLAFQDYLTELVDNADIVINDMPEDVPYNVDMSLAESADATDDTATEEETVADLSSPEAVEAALAEGLVITDDVVGDGAEAVSGSTVRVHFTGTLEDGTVFDSNVEGSDPFEFTLGIGKVIKGWDAGVVGMKVGGTRTLVIPPSLGYGSADHGSIPADSTLYFEITLVEVVQN